MSHGVTVTEIVAWYHVRVVSLVRKSRHYTTRFTVFDYEELLLSSGALTHMLTLPYLAAFIGRFPGRHNLNPSS